MPSAPASSGGWWPSRTTPTLDGVPVTYIRYVSPPRSRAYATWGAWVAPALRRALGRAANRADAGFDLIHAHNAVPTGDAALRAAPGPPLIVSVHGGDVLWIVDRVPHGAGVVTRTLRQADLVLANSHGIAELSRRYGAARADVLHLGADVPDAIPERSRTPLLVTVGHLVARKRHADVIEALALLPHAVRYRIIGDGPERAGLVALARQRGVADRVEFTGQLEPKAAVRAARRGLVVRDALNRGGVRRRLHRGDGGGHSGDRRQRRARPRRDRGRGRWDRARAAGRAPRPRRR